MNSLRPFRTLRAWWLRLGEVLLTHRRDVELSAEIESHLQLQIDDNLRAGMTPVEARRIAHIKLGGTEQVKESYRDRRGIPTLESVIQDVRFGLRVLFKNPGFTAVAALTLAFPFGANSALFSVVDAVLLKSLPYPDPHNLVEIWNTYPTLPQVGLSGADFQNWREQARQFSDIGGYRFVSQGFNVAGQGEPQSATARSAQLPICSRFTGVTPVLGRIFSTSEDKPGSAHLSS